MIGVIVSDYFARSGQGGLRAYRVQPDGGITFAVQLTDPERPMDLRSLRSTALGYLIHVNYGSFVDQLILLDKAGTLLWSRRYETGVGESYAFGQALIVAGGFPVLASSDPFARNVTSLSRYDPSGVPVAGCLNSEAVELDVVTLDIEGAELTYDAEDSDWGENFLGWEPSDILLADASCLPVCDQEEICRNDIDDDGGWLHRLRRPRPGG